MQDPTTIALNLAFLGTLGVAFVMFLGLLGAFVITLVIAGVGRLVATTVMALAGGLARLAGAARGAVPAQVTAVRAQAEPEPAPVPAAPAVKAARRDLPGSPVPAAKSPLAPGSSSAGHVRTPTGSVKHPVAARERKAG